MRSKIPQLQKQRFCHLASVLLGCIGILQPENALSMRSLGHTIPCVELAEEANNIVMDEFPLVSRHKEFCKCLYCYLCRVARPFFFLLVVPAFVDGRQVQNAWMYHGGETRKQDS
jgi:hypothetical protein